MEVLGNYIVGYVQWYLCIYFILYVRQRELFRASYYSHYV
jgi:hypothetical protein